MRSRRWFHIHWWHDFPYGLVGEDGTVTEWYRQRCRCGEMTDPEPWTTQMLPHYVARKITHINGQQVR